MPAMLDTRLLAMPTQGHHNHADTLVVQVHRDILAVTGHPHVHDARVLADFCLSR